MPPSRDLVSTGPRHVSTKVRNNSTRNSNGEKLTTARALVLRNGKHGARGTGELMLASKLSGREKLDLLAEDLVEKSRTAVMSPFRLEESLKIAESQCNAFSDDITNLRDPQLFIHLIQAELNARTKKDSKKPDPLKNPSYVASVVATRIHNTYMLASAWKLVSETLYDLAERGVTDGTIKSQLRNNPDIRARYLVLYDLVNILVNMGQARFSVLATTAAHYARYFKTAESLDPSEEEIIFDWAELREACVSFLDSIVIELCFPRAPYPKAILYQILSEAVEESPKEAKRFPQALWDAVGDLSVAIGLQQLLQAPLLGPDGQIWKGAPREMPTDYENWVDAQLYSQKASGNFANYKDIIFPLEKTKTNSVLDTMWRYINLNYKTVSGDDIDTLWGLSDALDFSPQWHAFYAPLHLSDDNSDGPSSLTSTKHKKHSKRLAITNGPANESDGSMPELQSISNSSDAIESEDDDDSDDDDGDSEDPESDDSGYDTEQEDELREMLREAMDIAHEADWLHSVKAEGDIDPFNQDDRKGNPFLKLLGSLRGRMFSSNPKLKTATRQEPLRPKLGRSVQTAAPQTPSPGQSPAKPKAGEAFRSYKATVEEVEDKDEVSVAPKKKKKKPKKKKPASADSQEVLAPVSNPQTSPPKSPTRESSAKPALAPPTSPTPPNKKATAKVGPAKSGSIASSSSFGSTASLPLPSETVAQSARSYLQSENLDNHKSKVKSRPNYATTFTEPEKQKKISIFSKIMGRGKAGDEEPKKGAKRSWFSRLGKKSKSLMHQLLNTAEDDTKGMKPMKWEDFLKVMRDMGFEYDPSTAGSSVRFDPPDKRDGPITFHKPHPDPTLQPIMLKDLAKRLKRRYGWEAEDLLKPTCLQK